MVATKKKTGKGLGRGLDALLGDAPKRRKPDLEAVENKEENQTAAGPQPRTKLPLEALKPNPDQPRRTFDDDAVKDLAASIKARGLLQPILVRPLENGDYQIVAGERRWRAAQRAQLHDVPVLIRELTDEETAEIALIENIQRVDLNPIEEAEAYARLASAHGRKQDEIAKAVGKSRSHVTNIMRLLDLPEATRAATIVGDITMGHARALLAAPNPDECCAIIVRDGLTVRDTEALVRSLSETSVKDKKPFLEDKKPAKSTAKKDADTRALEGDLAAALGLEVGIDHSKKGAGEVTIKYLNLDQLDDICRRLMGAGV